MYKKILISNTKQNEYFKETLGKSEILEDYSHIELRPEITNCCNFECSFCAHQIMKRKKGFMKDDLFNKILKEAKEIGIKTIDIRNMGEPLLDEKLVDRTQAASKLGFEVHTHTNGFLLNFNLFNELCEAGISYIILSLSPRTEFEKTRNRDFGVIENNLNEIARSNYKERLIVDMIGADHTQKEEEEFEQFLDNLGFQIRKKLITHNFATSNINALKYNYCHRLWNSFTINWNGDVPLCCMDYDGQLNLGNVYNNHIRDIINSSLYSEVRKEHLAGNFLEICLKCDNNHINNNLINRALENYTGVNTI
ncbi:MAG TPA: SPASM domain-containing protein [Methylomusa anaerophila]|uniref:Molybdenum cofactor biosynthesis protein A n=1 Tax=Methylomusa anaerophila TaxID=1930071 RepID=A0A348AER5_9FIRM|nr:radical SAM/SPASM domain-containing protein [Methylomusa anaerophila]BBB89563.1 molybdenum cofactor biosynthesis protein A [Methylomusa anaerophila]HML90069.1 SPASM domain-containing protein [Methylomusa anaerophila]